MEYGYIMAELKKRDILPIEKAIKSICKEEDFYYSDVIDYIKGDVSSQMHLTIFYGFIDSKIDKKKLKEHIKKINLKNLKLGKLFLMQGYQNQYKILCLEVLNENNKLKKIHDSFKALPHEITVQHDTFKPHLTLAYLKPNFTLNQFPPFPMKIEIKKIIYAI